MKKILTIFILAALVGLSSCKQDWVCQCNSNGTVTNTPINGGTFIHAEHTCHGMGHQCDLLTEGR